ncbi:hypothetical protein [Arthrobacter sp. CP30]
MSAKHRFHEGDGYGYRQGVQGEFQRVQFLRPGKGRQRKVLVRFLDEDDAEEWVPPQRLQVRWADVDQRRQDEANWARLTAASPDISEGLRYAVGLVFDTFLEPDVVHHSIDRGGGVACILNVQQLEEALGKLVPHHEDSYQSERGYIVPAAVSLEVARTLAGRDRGKTNRLVEQHQSEWYEEQLRNTFLRHGKPKLPQDHQYEEDTLLSWQYLREWGAG